MACSWHVGLRVEGLTEASLTSDVFAACLFQHSWRGLAGLSPSAFSEGARKLPKMLASAYCESLEPGAGLESHAGWSGWTGPPTIGQGGGGGGVASQEGGQRGVEGLNPKPYLNFKP